MLQSFVFFLFFLSDICDILIALNCHHMPLQYFFKDSGNSMVSVDVPCKIIYFSNIYKSTWYHVPCLLEYHNELCEVSLNSYDIVMFLNKL